MINMDTMSMQNLILCDSNVLIYLYFLCSVADINAFDTYKNIFFISDTSKNMTIRMYLYIQVARLIRKHDSLIHLFRQVVSSLF